MCCHENNAISHNQNGFVFEEDNFLLLFSGLIEPFGTNMKCSYGFNIGLITPWDTSLSNGFALLFMF